MRIGQLSCFKSTRRVIITVTLFRNIKGGKEDEIFY